VSLNRLSISCREPTNASCAGTLELTRLDNEAEEAPPVVWLSSPESTPIMTPETSDDEEENEPLLFPAILPIHESPDEAEPLLNVPVNDQNRARTLLQSSMASFERLSEEVGRTLNHQEESIDPPSAEQESSDEVEPLPEGTVNEPDKSIDSFSTPAALLEGYEDEYENFHDTELSSELYYGVLLSSIRAEDRETLESINPPTSTEPRSRLRIYRELKSLHEDETVPYLSVAPIDGNLSNCLASMEGAPDTPHQGGIFWLHIDFPDDYPVKAPVVKLLTPVYHPNFDEHGRICIDILEDAWSPCLQTQQVLLSILSVLHSPILADDEVLVPEIAEKYLLDNEDYCDIVRVYTASADGSRPDTSALMNLTTANEFDNPDSSQSPCQSRPLNDENE
jgi:ubiquitin-protein ligase